MAFIHFNLPLSAQKGASNAGRVIRDIAAAAVLPLYWGHQGHYGSDYLGMPSDPKEVEIVLNLLRDSKMHFEVVDELPYDMQYLVN